MLFFSGVKDNKKSGVSDLVKIIFDTQISNNAVNFLDYAPGFSEVFYFTFPLFYNLFFYSFKFSF